MKNNYFLAVLIFMFCQQSFAAEQKSINLADLDLVQNMLATREGPISFYELLSECAAPCYLSILREIHEGNYRGLIAIFRHLTVEQRFNLAKQMRKEDELAPLYFVVDRYADLMSRIKESQKKGYSTRLESLLMEEILVMTEALLEGFSQAELLSLICLETAKYNSPLVWAAKRGATAFLRLFFAKLSPDAVLDLVQNFREAGLSLYEIAFFSLETECAGYILLKIDDEKTRLDKLLQTDPTHGDIFLIYAVNEDRHSLVIDIFKGLKIASKISILNIATNYGLNLLNLAVVRHENLLKHEFYALKRHGKLAYGTGKLFDQSYEMIEEMISGVPSEELIKIIKNYGDKFSSALFLAANKGLTEIFKLFTLGLSAEQILELLFTEEEGQNLLFVSILKHEAVGNYILDYLEKNHPEKITYFLEQPNPRGGTFFRNAVKNGSVAIVERMLKLGAQPLVQGKYGNTVMHIASRRNSPRHIILLAKFEPLFNLQNGKKNTPLHMAVLRKNDDAIRTLLVLQVDQDIRNSEGKRAQDLTYWQTFLAKDQILQGHFIVARGPNYRVEELFDKDPKGKLPALFLYPDKDSNGALDVGESFLALFEGLHQTHAGRLKRASLPGEWASEMENYRQGPKLNFLLLATHGQPFCATMGVDEKKSQISVDEPQFCPECFNGALNENAVIFLCTCHAGKPMKEGCNLAETFAMLASPRTVIASSKSFGPSDIITTQTLPTWDGRIERDGKNCTVKLQAIPDQDLKGYFWIRALEGSGEQAKKWMGMGALRSLRNVKLPAHNH